MSEFLKDNFIFLSGCIIFLIVMDYFIIYLTKNKINDEILNKDEINKCNRIEVLENEIKFVYDILKLITIESRIFILASIGGIVFVTKQTLPNNITDLDKEMIKLLNSEFYVFILILTIYIIISTQRITRKKELGLIELKRIIIERIEVLHKTNNNTLEEKQGDTCDNSSISSSKDKI